MNNNYNGATGASRGNGLSDQPEAVQQLIITQLGLSSSKDPAAVTAARSLDQAILQLLGGIVTQLVGAGPGQKAMAPPDRTRGEFKRDYQLAPGHFETFPTWSFWGETFISLNNTGSVPTTVLVGDTRIFLNPGEQTETSGKWAAFPIRVTNTSELPGSEITVRVW